jgi:hypothetical protein
VNEGQGMFGRTTGGDNDAVEGLPCHFLDADNENKRLEDHQKIAREISSCVG